MSVHELSHETKGSWRTASLNELGQLYCGQSPASSTVNTNGLGTLYVSGPEQWDGHKIRQDKWTNDPKRLVPDGCVFITVKGAGVGKIFPGISCAIGRDVYAFKPKAELSAKFIEHAIRFTVQDVLRHAVGDIPGLSKAHILQHEIGIPSPQEQERIVAEIEKQFSRLDEAVANLKRVKANLKCYKASVLKAAVEGKLTEDWRKQHSDVEPASKLLERILAERREKWSGKGKYKEAETPNVSDLPQLPQRWAWCLTDALFSFVTSGSRGWAKYYSDEGPLFLRVGNLDHDSIRLDLSDVQRVKPLAGAEGTRTRVESGDILISITADVGMIAVVPAGLGDAYINQHVSLARPLDGFCREYLAWYLAARDGGQRMFLQLQRGATKVGLGLDDIRAVPVPLPPLAEQEQIVAEVERRLTVIDELEATVEANLTRAIRLRQSVLSQAFKGNLIQ